jgi:hypothetical protein
VEKVSQERLDMFINGTHGWKTLPSHEVLAMAIELKRYREADKNNRGTNGH